MRFIPLALLSVIWGAPPQAYAAGSEFEAAIGRTGYGRCHMDGCTFFIIDETVPVGSTKRGTLFAVSVRWWSAEYRPTDDGHEYDRPPKSVSPRRTGISMVFCSKTAPVTFDFYEGQWASTELRPGDESAVSGATETSYQFYFAACHHYITKDPFSKAMARRLGYKFAAEPGKEDTPSDAGPKEPMDVLR